MKQWRSLLAVALLLVAGFCASAIYLLADAPPLPKNQPSDDAALAREEIGRAGAVRKFELEQQRLGGAALGAAVGSDDPANRSLGSLVDLLRGSRMRQDEWVRANLTFTSPTTMRVRESRTAALVIGDLVAFQPIDVERRAVRLAGEDKDAAAGASPRTVINDQTEVTTEITANLEGSDAIKIRAASPVRQKFSRSRLMEWAWIVNATEVGNHQMVLTIVTSGETPQVIATKQYSVTVESLPANRFTDTTAWLMGRDWFWKDIILAGIMAGVPALLGFLGLRLRKHEQTRPVGKKVRNTARR